MSQITFDIHDIHTLMGLQTHIEEPTSFWRDTFFSTVMTFDSEYIDFEKVVKGRKLAPFVAPMMKGKPNRAAGSTFQRFKPAYIKMLDALDPTKTIKRRPGETPVVGSLNPAARANAILMDYMQEHRDMKGRREEWMAARAILDGGVTITGEDYPTVYVDFQRDAGQTITKSVGAKWGDSGVSIIKDLEAWILKMRRAKFGGNATRLTVSPDVWDVMRKDEELMALCDTQFRGMTQDMMNVSIMDGSTLQRVAVYGGFLEVYVYQDWYEDDDGNIQEFMPAGTVLLTAPAVGGVRAYGAIMDHKAGLQPMEIFSKQYEEDNPSAIFLLTQSAPLLIPTRPNCTLKATVL